MSTAGDFCPMNQFRRTKALFLQGAHSGFPFLSFPFLPLNPWEKLQLRAKQGLGLMQVESHTHSLSLKVHLPASLPLGKSPNFIQFQSISLLFLFLTSSSVASSSSSSLLASFAQLSDHVTILKEEEEEEERRATTLPQRAGSPRKFKALRPNWSPISVT